MTWDLHLHRVPIRCEQVVGGLGARLPGVNLPMLPNDQVVALREQIVGPVAPWIGVAGLLALVVVAARRRDPGSLFALINLAVLLIYFDYDERILLPAGEVVHSVRQIRVFQVTGPPSGD